MNRILSWFLVSLLLALSGPVQALSMASARGFEKSLYGRSAPTQHKYSYCGGDPINRVDPSGLDDNEPGPPDHPNEIAYQRLKARAIRAGYLKPDPPPLQLTLKQALILHYGLLLLGAWGEFGAPARFAPARGLSPRGTGIMSSHVNEAGGTVWTSTGEIYARDYGHAVNRGLYQGEVNILSGVHGFRNGAVTADLAFIAEDLRLYGHVEGVTVHNFMKLSFAELESLVKGKGTTIAGFCNSEAVLKFLGLMK